ncbi:UPF0481 protein-like [Iris pallida]|uniref:UPF0481 protein-like n=1 Tax=Iris pallida TaxID=29817 RepID=A0AAX6EC09_IRIPA|nr:UPF0481 protein-like [Iris pallida]
MNDDERTEKREERPGVAEVVAHQPGPILVPSRVAVLLDILEQASQIARVVVDHDTLAQPVEEPGRLLVVPKPVH